MASKISLTMLYVDVEHAFSQDFKFSYFPKGKAYIDVLSVME